MSRLMTTTTNLSKAITPDILTSDYIMNLHMQVRSGYGQSFKNLIDSVSLMKCVEAGVIICNCISLSSQKRYLTRLFKQH
jgi:hypothetical protein